MSKTELEVFRLFRRSTHTHTWQEWIMSVIRWELNPLKQQLGLNIHIKVSSLTKYVDPIDE